MRSRGSSLMKGEMGEQEMEWACVTDKVTSISQL